MRKTAEEILNLPMKEGELSNPVTVQEAVKSNMTLGQSIVLKQAQSALQGSTDAAMFLQAVSGEEEEVSDSTAISDAAKAGDTMGMLVALRDKLTEIIDRSTNAREITATTRQLVEINDRIEEMKKDRANKAGENPLNVIKLRSAEKRTKRIAGA